MIAVMASSASFLGLYLLVDIIQYKLKLNEAANRSLNRLKNLFLVCSAAIAVLGIYSLVKFLWF
jgi:hypothetical protein